jgi:hypothetical protein
VLTGVVVQVGVGPAGLVDHSDASHSSLGRWRLRRRLLLHRLLLLLRRLLLLPLLLRRPLHVLLLLLE